MPYSKISELPDNIKKLSEDKQKQWLAIFNSAFAKAKEKKMKDEDAEESAFKQANGIVFKESEFNISGGFKELQQKLTDAVRRKVGVTAWVNDADSIFVYFDVENQTTHLNEGYRATYKSIDGEFEIGNPEEIEFKSIVIPKRESKSFRFKESNFHFLESNDPEGKDWDVVVIEEGKSLNLGSHELPRYYPEKALKAATESKLFSKAPVMLYNFDGKYGRYNDHVPLNVQESKPEGLAGNIVGWISDERYDTFKDENGKEKKGVLGKLHISEGFEWLRKTLKDAYNAGKNLLGISIDGDGSEYPFLVEGESVDYVDSITKIMENTLVTSPAAGGRFLRLAASQNNQPLQGVKEMELTKILELIKSVKPKLLEGKDLTKLTEAEAEALLKEAMKEPETIIPEPPKVDSPKVDEVKVDELTQKVEKLTESLAVSQKNVALQTRLMESNLPDDFKKDIQRRYENRNWTETDLNADVKAEQDKAAKLKESTSKLGDQSRVQITSDEKTKLQLAMDGLFFNEDQKDADGKKVSRFISFKESYAKIVNDPSALWAGAQTILGDAYQFIPDMKTTDAHLFESYDIKRRRALRESRMREGLQTSDFAEILADAINKRMQKEVINPDLNAWRRITSDIVPFTNFQSQKRVQLGGYGILSTVAERGTYQSLTSPGDTQATMTPAKKGGLEDLTMEMVANDDVGAIRQIPIKLGRAAGQTIFRDIFDMFLNNLEQDGSTTLASSARGNYITTALSTAGYGELRYAMRSLANYGDTYDLLGSANIPAILLVPNELEDTAKRVSQSDIAVSAIYTAGTSHYNTQTEPNIWKGDIKDVIVIDYWTDATDYWGIADPAKSPTIEVGFYQGREEPELFVQDMPNVGSMFNADKITYKIRYIYYFGVLDFRHMALSHQ